ncbi:MAG: hypothetical protein QOH81_1732 [Sphingomonadales bacterium]|jgi:uncharacterized repeat protein (TIGR01451 family)|nr:hypothetical protein [Sphingomonadales bacterium]
MRLRFLALAALLAPWAAPAAASCSAANTYNFSFSNQAAATLNYANSYTYTASTSGGANQNFTTSFSTNGLTSSVVGGAQMPAISTLLTTGTGGRTLMIGGTFSGRTASIAGATRVILTTFTFATPIRDLSLTVHDIDYANDQYRDWLMVTGANGASTYTPVMTTPFGTNNTTGGTAGSSSLTLGPTGAPYNLTAQQAVGTGASANNNSNFGDIAISFAQPVTSVTIRYGNYPFSAGESNTGQQAFGVSAISFCPMPSVSTAKTSAPLGTTGAARFNAPGSDVVYTITVTNNGGSPVDASTIVLTDTLPASASFYNADFDTSLPGADPFYLTAGSSGVTLAAANVTYSNNGATYGYTPAAGYDGTVKGVKFSPQGTMAANSSFTVKYRVQVK